MHIYDLQKVAFMGGWGLGAGVRECDKKGNYDSIGINAVYVKYCTSTIKYAN